MLVSSSPRAPPCATSSSAHATYRSARHRSNANTHSSRGQRPAPLPAVGSLWVIVGSAPPSSSSVRTTVAWPSEVAACSGVPNLPRAFTAAPRRSSRRAQGSLPNVAARCKGVSLLLSMALTSQQPEARSASAHARAPSPAIAAVTCSGVSLSELSGSLARAGRSCRRECRADGFPPAHARCAALLPPRSCGGDRTSRYKSIPPRLERGKARASLHTSRETSPLLTIMPPIAPLPTTQRLPRLVASSITHRRSPGAIPLAQPKAPQLASAPAPQPAKRITGRS